LPPAFGDQLIPLRGPKIRLRRFKELKVGETFNVADGGIEKNIQIARFRRSGV
jgi:hypothetical protein